MHARFLTRPALLALSAGFLMACASGSKQFEADGDVEPMRSATSIATGWSAKHGDVERMLTNKYGQPDVVSDQVIAWHNRGAFVRIALMRSTVQHDYPMPHIDFLTHTVKHRVPAGKVAELWQFDGSVWAHRTRGELMAQCDIEPNNLLALNVAHEIIMGKRSVAEARDFFARTATAYMNGDRSSKYMSDLLFQPEPGSADRDMPHKE